MAQRCSSGTQRAGSSAWPGSSRPSRPRPRGRARRIETLRLHQDAADRRTTPMGGRARQPGTSRSTAVGDSTLNPHQRAHETGPSPVRRRPSPTEPADQAGRHCLTLLEDPEPFAQRVRPTFSIDHYAHRALWQVLPAATDAVHTETADMLLRILPDRPGESAETGLIKLAAFLRSRCLSESRGRVPAGQV
jgi:hypothetical protein